MKLKVAIVQYDANEPNINFNTEVAIKYIKEAKDNGADIVLFPECFLSAYCVPDICEELLPIEEIKDDPEFVDWCNRAVTENEEHVLKIREIAKKLNIGVVITAFTKGEKCPQNSAFVIDRNGEIILKYSKVHTCDFDWERYLESGQEFKVCEFDGVKIGVMICYDREYPESARELMLRGAEIIFNPNCCGGMEPRLKELSVRAMENMVGVAMANPPAEGMGCSCAFNPMVWGENGEVLDNTMIVADEYYEGIIYAEFDMDIIRKYREREDLGKFRKPKAYRYWRKDMEKDVQEYIEKYSDGIKKLYLNLRKLVLDSVTVEVEERLWAKLPSYYVRENFVRLIPFKDHINIEAKTLVQYKDGFSDYKMTPKGMLQVFVNQDVPEKLLLKVFQESLLG